jgi:hypothetical protein
LFVVVLINITDWKHTVLPFACEERRETFEVRTLFPTSEQPRSTDNRATHWPSSRNQK